MRTLLLTLLAAVALAAADKPNIVLIVSDDQGWWDVGVNGNTDIETPRLDRLAADGVNMTRFYAAPVCAPTRAGLMTGRYALRGGIYNTRFGGDTLRLDATLLPQILKQQGYRTGMFGKWHLGGHGPYGPESRGFDTALTFTHGHHERYYYPELQLNGKPVDSRGYITDVFTDAAIEFLRDNGDQPFFLYVPYNVPHSPHFVDDAFIEPYLEKGLALRDARIYGMITHMDQAVGRLLDAMDDEGLRENTLVVFLGDNGGVSRHNRLWLRGGKGSPFEGGIRIPAFFRWTGKIPAGESVDAMASHLDLLPTVCAILGIDPPSAQPLDGKSILPLLEAGGGESPHELLFHHWDRHRPRLDKGWSVTGGRWKRTFEGLYDLEADPGETQDVSAEHPEVAEKLFEAYRDYLAEASRQTNLEPFPIPVGDEPVEIQASWARVNGTHTTWSPPGSGLTAGPDPLGDPARANGINYTFAGYDWDSIDGWNKPGQSVFWRLQTARAGRYRVRLAYGSSPADAGGVLRLRAGEARLDVQVEATPGPNVFVRRDAGVIALPAGAVELKAEVVSSPGKELMTLNRIWLERIEE